MNVLFGFQRDSGSPLIKENEDGQVEVIGVVRSGFGRPCCDAVLLTEYVQVSLFTDWIETTIKSNGGNDSDGNNEVTFAK